MKRRLLKVLKFLAIALVVVVVILAVAAFWFVRRSWPETEGTIEAAGLSAPVEVVRDEWGVPHIYAQNERDLFFAQGWVHAQDRLWQMEFSRHVSGATLSELFGPPTVDADKGLRAYGIRREAEGDLAALAPETRAILEAYSRGVNAYVEANRGRLPLEFTILGVNPKPWTPVDSLAWARMIALSLGQNHAQELTRARLAAKVGPQAALRLIAPYPDDAAVIITPEAGGYGGGPHHPGPLLPTSSQHPSPGEEGEIQDSLAAFPSPALLGRGQGRGLAAFLGSPGLLPGSNNWVVHGSRTATGKAMLANDTHLGLGMPSPWYENGLHGGRFNVEGFSFAGVPLVLIGRNQRIAWGISNMCGDSQDLFIEEMDGRKVKVDGQWQDARVVKETINVKGGQPVTHEIVVTPNGTIINEAAELKGLPPMALRWTLAEPSRLLDAVAGYNTATDWASFRQALSVWGAPTLNFVYADVDGNIGYQGVGLIPVRAPGQEGLVPVPPSPNRGWTGFLPFNQMPSLYNPPAGFIVSANNKVVRDSYPHLIGRDFADPYRAERITQQLAANPKVTVDDMRALQADTYAVSAAALRPYLVATVQPADDRERQALDLVRNWDLRFTTESAGATAYFAWLNAFLPNIFKDELGDDLAKVYRGFAFPGLPTYVEMMKTPADPWFDDKRTKDKAETRDDIVRRAFRESVADMAKRLGENPAEWQWGKLHTSMLAHQPFGNSGIPPLMALFNGKSYPLPGEGSTVNAQAPNFDNPFQVGFGVSQRLIVDLGDPSQALGVNSTGQSGQAFHRHRDDQTLLWSRNEYRPMLFSKEAVEKGAKERMTLQPK